MHKSLAFGLASFLFASPGPSSAGTVHVSFVHPETYTDASLSGGHGSGAERWTLDEIGRYLEGLGASYLGQQQTLKVEVLNVDLAGKFEWWRRPGAYDFRILRDIYPPRFTLHYHLTEAGRTLVEGQETVVDPNYLANPAIYFSSSDPLRFEKAMLADWFRARFSSDRSTASLR
jgi:hypothetical protein